MVIETSAFLNRVPLRLQMGHLHGMAENEIVRKELQYENLHWCVNQLYTTTEKYRNKQY